MNHSDLSEQLDRVVTVCVCYNNRATGGSEMLSMERAYATPPQVDDMIEVIGPRGDAWHERVARRYLGVTENPIEIHVELPRRELSLEAEAELRAEGYS